MIEKFDEGNEEDDQTSVVGLRKRSTHILEETDRRYAGKATSRKELQKQVAGSGKRAVLITSMFLSVVTLNAGKRVLAICSTFISLYAKSY